MDYSRRSFLRWSGVALAGAALTPSMVLADSEEAGGKRMEKSSKKIRIGVVGGGFGAAFHWHLHPNCIVEAVSDLREDRRKHLQNVYKCDKAYNSLEELVKDRNVDAVAVFTGAPDHVKHCVTCMKAGKHVISAVPACMSLEEAEELLETQQKTGLTYMMAETSYYHPVAISARKFYMEGKFGDIYYTEAEYHHAGMEYTLWKDAEGKPTWRWGFPPMLYPTHCTSFLVGTTGERLVEVTCIGWGDGDPIMDGNPYNNKFWNETALFKTDKGHAFRVSINWRGAFGGCERAQWYGSKMSLFEPHPNGVGAVIRRATNKYVKDSAGYDVGLAEFERYEPPNWAELLLPEPLRVGGGHEGAEPFLTHEFVDALLNERTPAIDIYEALAYTVPGIIAHKSALEGGKHMKVPVYKRKA
ncbi:MAG: Gfo/Idh/MocA family oxidoreductase [Armatimonadota bacterium]|nr:Gfo/Idh/MocA family oxidoreductase [Armatimonadota bacterium]